MRMGVDQAGNKDVSGPVDNCAGFIAAAGLCRWQNIDDSAIGDGNGMMRQDASIGFDRNTPVGGNEGIAMLHFRGLDGGRRAIWGAKYNGQFQGVQKSYKSPVMPAVMRLSVLILQP